MSIVSNLRDVQRCVVGLGETFNLRRRSRGGARTVGQGLSEVVAGLIRHRTVVLQLDDQGKPLRSLKRSYLLWKLRHGYPKTISVMTGDMMELEQLIGQVTVTRDVLSMTYGRDNAARTEAEWFQEGFQGQDRLGRDQDRPERHIYDLGKDGERAVGAYLDEVAGRQIKDLGG